MNKRLDYMDAISGVMILRMIYLHCCGFSSISDHPILYRYLGCFLLWFFFRGG